MDFEVRRARVDDAEAISAVRIATWRTAYAHLLSAEFLAAMPETSAMWRSVIERDRPIWVAETEGRVFGIAAAREAQGEDAVRARELALLYVLEEFHGTGAGQALIDAALGDEPAQLWVAEDNPRAIAFYRRNGFAPDGTRKIDDEFEGLAEIRLVR